MLAPGAPVRTLGRYLRERYGRRLRRVLLDLGGTCPNRDGRDGYGGCIYCDLKGSGTGAAARESLQQQFERELRRVRRNQPEGPAAIAYLQSYSNTYPDLLPLARALDWLATRAAEAPILAVGTRPDCFSAEAAELLAFHAPAFSEIWVEFGLETADDRVQKLIGRHDRLENFHRATALARSRGLGVVAHMIHGLPGDAPDTLLRQVREARQAGVQGVKFHHLLVLRRTKLAAWWRQGRFLPGRPEDYVRAAADALEELPASTVVHRLAAAAPEAELLAPRDWPSPKQLHAAIEKELRRRGTTQGARLEREAARRTGAGPDW